MFSGSAHPQFAAEMCQILGVELSPSRTTRFSNDCLQVQLRANCRQRDVYVVQPLVPPAQENLTGPAIKRLEQEPNVSEIVITNTVPLPPEKRLANIVTRSVAPLFAEAVHRIHAGESVSSLFSSAETYG